MAIYNNYTNTYVQCYSKTFLDYLGESCFFFFYNWDSCQRIKLYVVYKDEGSQVTGQGSRLAHVIIILEQYFSHMSEK